MTSFHGPAAAPSPALRSLSPWRDRRGRFCAVRLSAFVAAAAPAGWIAYALAAGQLGAEPIKQATHLAGTWTLYVLMATLAVTPLKRLLAWPRLAGLRRMLGLATFCYAAAHLALYAVDQGGDPGRIAGEIASRTYLTIGFAALIGLAALAATSFDAAIRRLGRTWKRLHRAAYGVTALGLLHFFLQAKIDVSGPVVLAGVFLGLMAHRLGVVIRLGMAAGTLVVAAAAGLAAAGIEYAWYAGTSGIPAGQVFLANFDLDHGLRPMWIVMMICTLPLPLHALKALSGLAGRLAASRTGMRTCP